MIWWKDDNQWGAETMAGSRCITLQSSGTKTARVCGKRDLRITTLPLMASTTWKPWHMQQLIPVQIWRTWNMATSTTMSQHMVRTTRSTTTTSTMLLTWPNLTSQSTWHVSVALMTLWTWVLCYDSLASPNHQFSPPPPHWFLSKPQLMTYEIMCETSGVTVTWRTGPRLSMMTALWDWRHWWEVWDWGVWRKMKWRRNWRTGSQKVSWRKRQLVINMSRVLYKETINWTRINLQRIKPQKQKETDQKWNSFLSINENNHKINCCVCDGFACNFHIIMYLYLIGCHVCVKGKQRRCSTAILILVNSYKLLFTGKQGWALCTVWVCGYVTVRSTWKNSRYRCTWRYIQ